MIQNLWEKVPKQFSINLIAVSGLIEKWKNRKVWKEKKVFYMWVYECGCNAPEAHQSLPYCPIHGMRLERKEI